jgi:hypothetical protein
MDWILTREKEGGYVGAHSCLGYTINPQHNYVYFADRLIIMVDGIAAFLRLSEEVQKAGYYFYGWQCIASKLI